MIQGIKQLRSEIELEPLGNPELLDDANVKIIVVVSNKDVATRSVTARQRNSKSVSVCKFDRPNDSIYKLQVGFEI